MILSRRMLLAAPALLPAAALAQPAFPAGRPVRIVVPFPAGGSTDVITRHIAEALRAAWGSAVTIENRPGAGGNIGAEAVVRAPATGHDLLMGSFSLATNRHIMATMPFDPARDFAPISLVATVPNALLVRPGLAATDIAGFIALARAREGQLTYGSAGIGTSSHLAGVLFERLTGVRMTHVPYRGTGPALNDLVADRLDLMFDILTAAIPQVRGGQVRALGVTGAETSPVLPDLVPIQRSVPGFLVETWNGLFAPAATPREVVMKLAADVDAALATAPVRTVLAPLGVTPIGGAPERLAAHLAAESARWGELVRSAGIREA